MTHGTKDFGNVYPKKTTYRLDDMAELAARLGAFNVFDRLGETLLQDNFGDGIERAFSIVYGTGASVALTSEKHSSGGFCAKLITGSDDNMSAQLSYAIHYPYLSKIGLEFAFSTDDHAPVVRSFLWIMTGTVAIKARVQYIPGTEVLQYYDENGDWIDLETGVVLYHSHNNFHRFKVVADFDERVFVRTVLDQGVYSMKDLPLYIESDTTDPYILAGVYTYRTISYNSVTYIDDVIVTQNEV